MLTISARQSKLDEIREEDNEHEEVKKVPISLTVGSKFVQMVESAASRELRNLIDSLESQLTHLPE